MRAGVLPTPYPRLGKRGWHMPNMIADRRRISRRVASIVAWWTLYGLMMATQIVGAVSPAGTRLTWLGALEYAYASAWPWIPMTFFVYFLTRRFPIGRRDWWRNLLLHAVVIAVFIVCKGVYAYYTNPVFGWYSVLPALHEVLASSVSNNLMLGWMVVGVAHGVVYFERMEERDQAFADLERSLVSARLEALRSQLNPHFLFNALNSVSELMQTDVEQADRMLVAICEMLRDSLKAHDSPERPLREELRQLSSYLTIEGIRLGERLSSSIEAEDACLDVQVPILSLQPLVENAIVHSIARVRKPGWVNVKCWIDGDDLNIRVENSCFRIVDDKPGANGNGVGLRLVADRLSLLYGSRGEIHRVEDDKAYAVNLVIPISGQRNFRHGY